MIDKKSYSLSKNEMTGESVYFEYDKVNGYQVMPKTKKKDEIEVSKIVFVNDSMSEKIIRKKIDKKIDYLLMQLKLIDEDGNPDSGGIRRNLMDAEKLKIQIINNYVKYLGHTYESLTLKKIQIIINQLRFKLYTVKNMERQNMIFKNMMNVKEDNMEYDKSEKGRGR